MPKRQADFRSGCRVLFVYGVGRSQLREGTERGNEFVRGRRASFKGRTDVVVCGCYSDSRGIRRKSVVVADRGRILGVSDMLNQLDSSEYRPGAGIKIYDTKAG